MTTHILINDIHPTSKTAVLLDLFSLTKPRLSSLVIFTSALGMFLAPGEITFVKAIFSILATSGLVGGACAINCYMEKDIDALMDRTKDRPLPSGRISANTALELGIALITLCLTTLFVLVNPFTAFLGLVATITYVFLYTPLKKKSPWALFAGAIPGAIPPLMGWTTVTQEASGLGLVLFSILFIWQIPHFLSIALYHLKDYDKAEIKTHPGHMGTNATIHRIAAYTLLLFLVSLGPYFIGSASVEYRNFIFILGGGYFLYSLIGYLYQDGSAELMQWARRYFYGSLIYLPCVFFLMICFKLNS